MVNTMAVMTEQQKKMVTDLRDYLTWAIDNDEGYGWILSMLGHDMNILVESMRGIGGGLPRSNDWAKKGDVKTQLESYGGAW